MPGSLELHLKLDLETGGMVWQADQPNLIASQGAPLVVTSATGPTQPARATWVETDLLRPSHPCHTIPSFEKVYTPRQLIFFVKLNTLVI